MQPRTSILDPRLCGLGCALCSQMPARAGMWIWACSTYNIVRCGALSDIEPRLGEATPPLGYREPPARDISPTGLCEILEPMLPFTTLDTPSDRAGGKNTDHLAMSSKGVTGKDRVAAYRHQLPLPMDLRRLMQQAHLRAYRVWAC